MKTTRFFLLGLSLLLFSQCWRKKDEPAPAVIDLPQGLKDLALFRNGTYWVYRNEQTGVLDSVSVSGFERDTVDVYEPGNAKPRLLHRRDTFRYLTTSSLTGQRLRYEAQMFCFGGYNPAGTCHAISRRVVSSAGGDGSFTDYLLYRPLPGASMDGLFDGSQVSVATVVGTLPSLMVQGQEYREVVHMRISYNPTEVPVRSESDYYIAPGVGLVRRETNLGGPRVRWDVVRKRIVK